MSSESLLSALSAAGFSVSSVHELRESGKRYTAAIPVLVEALSQTSDPRELDAIVRALSVPWAKKSALAPLLARFRSLPHEGDPRMESVRWAIGNAIEVIWDDKLYEELVEVAADRRYGKAREMIVEGARKSMRPEVVDMLISLLDDPDVNGHAVRALSKVKLPIGQARVPLEGMLNDDRPWVRTAAERALNASAS